MTAAARRLAHRALRAVLWVLALGADVALVAGALLLLALLLGPLR
jgi:hypothetical protein